MGLMGVGYGFVILAAIISFAAQMYVQSAYSKYSQVDTFEHLSGAQVARRILDLKNIDDVQVVESSGGELSDHYDPTKKVVALSPKVYHETSIASVSVAGHECGHAIQHAENYGFIALRNKVLPFAIVASKFSMIPIMIGLFGSPQFLKIGIILLCVIAIFQLVTLPVEFDASLRAIKILEQESLLDSGELQGSKKMLTAAALTYVAALVGTLLSILRYIAIYNRRND
ncbi:zinc metallopeptidase [Erysipelothrix rhusiopathiae]|uniref:zinc metallopeptidase n=1 Tax=Erysipelothrix rhusiopathiae TaxID=1648 RepID=UPI002B25621E|nr:zinc metallopeptidase [Erysipelothrix rhusiopathiae]WRB92313.1 zinc metallopeptidase [Erysipelothrix rhusiopathiae]